MVLRWTRRFCRVCSTNQKMSDAFVETTVFTDILLKPGTPKQKRARAAFERFQHTLLPVYSIKEWKAGPLNYFAYVHDKLAFTKSLRKTLIALSSLPVGYRKNTSYEALAAAAVNERYVPMRRSDASRDTEMADRYRLALRSLIIRSWRKRRYITSHVIQDLDCYTEVEPQIGKDGFFDLSPQYCERDRECCLSSRLKSEPHLLRALRDAIPETSVREEDRRRRKVLKQLINRPKDPLDREMCRALGDAIFAFFCPPGATVLTTNLKDHQPLARAVGKEAEKP
jgi:hypothetical protein